MSMLFFCIEKVLYQFCKLETGLICWQNINVKSCERRQHDTYQMYVVFHETTEVLVGFEVI